jgi:hypothetical protein
MLALRTSKLLFAAFIRLWLRRSCWRTQAGLVSLLALAVTAATPGVASAAVEISPGIYVKDYIPARPATSATSGSAGATPLISGGLGPSCKKKAEPNCPRMSVPVEFHGGRVIRSPRIYLIFWGSSWTHDEEGEHWRSHVRNTLGGLTEEYGFNLTFQHILSQYFDNTGPVEGVKIAGEYVYEGISAPQGQEEEDIKTEVEDAISQNGWAREPNSLFVLLQPPGTAYQESFATAEQSGCGFHGRDRQNDVYAFIPDLSNKFFSEKCGGYAQEGETILYNRIITFVASHEYSEAVTDPEERGWSDSEGNEVADICEEHGPIKVNEALGIWSTGVWGNHEAAEKGENEGCVTKDPPEPSPPAPSVTTEPATSPTRTEVTLEGKVDPNGPDAHYYFEYGPTTSYGNSFPTPPGTDAGFGTSSVAASAKLSGLEPGKTYHYRLVASSWAGTSYGADRTFRTRGWTIQATVDPHGESAELEGVSCVSASSCTAVGSYVEAEHRVTLAEHWNGATWEALTTPNPSGTEGSFLESVSCPTSSECTATGYYEAKGKHDTLAEHEKGSTWSIEKTPTKGTIANLASVACVSESECTAVGSYISGEPGERSSLVEVWNGETWKVKASAKLPAEDEEAWFEAVSCPAAKACMAVGATDTSSRGVHTLAESWNGSKWSLQQPSEPGHSSELHLRGVSCSAASACTATGDYINGEAHGDGKNTRLNGQQSLVERWNGSTWALQESPSPVGKPQAEEETHWALSKVSCASANACVAIGSYGDTQTEPSLLLGEQWNGTTWELESPFDRLGVQLDELTGISCSAATTCTAVGYSIKTVGRETLAERLEEH